MAHEYRVILTSPLGRSGGALRSPIACSSGFAVRRRALAAGAPGPLLAPVGVGDGTLAERVRSPAGGAPDAVGAVLWIRVFHGGCRRGEGESWNRGRRSGGVFLERFIVFVN